MFLQSKSIYMLFFFKICGWLTLFGLFVHSQSKYISKAVDLSNTSVKWTLVDTGTTVIMWFYWVGKLKVWQNRNTVLYVYCPSTLITGQTSSSPSHALIAEFYVKTIHHYCVCLGRPVNIHQLQEHSSALHIVPPTHHLHCMLCAKVMCL